MILQLCVGSLYICLCVLFTPLYIKIIHVFIVNKKYRYRKGYRLMTQIGIAQCLTCPGLLLLGYSVVVGHDTSHIASFFMRIMNGCRRIEAILSVALALERFQAVFALKKLRYLVDILTLLAWTYGSANIALLNSPLADFTVVPETFGPVYNKSLPWTEVIEKANLFSSITASLITFVFYVIIICQLVRQKFVIKTLKIEVHEKSILVQAFVRFFGDTTMTVFYHIVPLFLPHSKLLEIVTTLGYLINNLVLPPVLSVIVSRTLRTDVFLFMLKVSTVQPS